MMTGPIIAEIATLVGDPARATMVSALVDGGALAASELASAARITPQTASSAARIWCDHLAGRLSVDLAESFVAREYIVLDDEVAEVTPAGTRVLTESGITLPARHRPAATSADSASIGPIGAGTSRVGGGRFNRAFRIPSQGFSKP